MVAQGCGSRRRCNADSAGESVSKLPRPEIRIRCTAGSRDEIIFPNPLVQLGTFSLGLSSIAGRSQRPWKGDRTETQKTRGMETGPATEGSTCGP